MGISGCLRGISETQGQQMYILLCMNERWEKKAEKGAKKIGSWHWKNVTIESFVRKWEEKEETKQVKGRRDGGKMPENSLKNKRFILFLYRKAIKKQFAVCARKKFPSRLFQGKESNFFITSAFILVSPPHHSALQSNKWFIYVFPLKRATTHSLI
jgi:hypothetical protein